MPKLLYVVTEDWYFYSHRLPMARAAQRAGYDVTVVTNIDKHAGAIVAAGMKVIPLQMERRSLNPFAALRHINHLCRIYKAEKPDVVHHIAMKPVLFGAIAAALTGVPRVINAFAGLGYVFSADTGLARVLRPLLVTLFRPLLKRKGSVLLLQNADDRALLAGYGLTPPGDATVLIRGSGVDLEAYPAHPFVPPAPDMIFVFSGRMIGIKGLQTLQDAFNLLEIECPHARLWLCGRPDPANPGSWDQQRMAAWAQRPNVEWHGHCNDMAVIWRQAHVGVQASYGGEGVPKSLLEAASCGRAIVATNVPGCREVVVDGDNGYLVPPRDARALADAIKKLANDPEKCAAMGKRSRALVASDLSADSVSAQAEALYRSCLPV
ncbi:MAG: glycosyltransferase family 4 protein [Alphaproteobacteria bacterium]|nr:glycosyltransferase family 4 protein [Alphaproteobacteria bacterium]